MRPLLARTHTDLLDRASLGHLATVRSDGQPRASVVDLAWDGWLLRVGLPLGSPQLADIDHEPRIALSLVDAPTRRSLDVQAVVTEVDETDPERRVLTCRPTAFLAYTDRMVVPAR